MLESTGVYILAGSKLSTFETNLSKKSEVAKRCREERIMPTIHKFYHYSGKAVSYEELFPRHFGVGGGGGKFLGKKNISYDEIFRKNFLAQNFLSKKKLEYSHPRKFSSPKFPGDKRIFFEEILGSLDNRTEISTPSQYWMMPTAVRTHDCVLCCTQTCIESHNRCPKSLDERAWQDCCTRWSDD